MKVVNFVRGMVAWLLLWPLDLVDYFCRDCCGFTSGHSVRAMFIMATVMLGFYGTVTFCVIDILRLTVFRW